MLKSNLLMNCLWYEDISPDELSIILELTSEQLYRKIFQEEDFTEEEIKKITDLLGLSVSERDLIFYS